ncbi:MAG: hypothetical protein Q4B99_03495, partial [Clostridia bacterium]|nr:hypothetical protein [Clostridia bacterium]
QPTAGASATPGASASAAPSGDVIVVQDGVTILIAGELPQTPPLPDGFHPGECMLAGQDIECGVSGEGLLVVYSTSAERYMLLDEATGRLVRFEDVRSQQRLLILPPGFGTGGPEGFEPRAADVLGTTVEALVKDGVVVVYAYCEGLGYGYFRFDSQSGAFMLYEPAAAETPTPSASATPTPTANLVAPVETVRELSSLEWILIVALLLSLGLCASLLAGLVRWRREARRREMDAGLWEGL